MEYFDVSYCHLAHLPESLGGLVSRDSLVLTGSELTGLPKSIGDCNKLRRLDISHNQFKSLPAVLGQCHNLKTLIASSNHIKVLPKDIWTWSISELFLEQNQLQALPELYTPNTRLVVFLCAGIELTALPSTIGYFESLMNLRLQENRLTALPTSITKCSSLGYIDLSFNRMTHLPMDIERYKPVLDIRMHESDV